MKALSILQPWAWLIVHGYKDIENRTWRTNFRGRFLVHAGKRWGREQVNDYLWVIANTDIGLDIPPLFAFENEVGFRGAIVGEATITDCISQSNSMWFNGPYGFLLSNPRAYDQPIPQRGALGFFNPDRSRESLPQE